MKSLITENVPADIHSDLVCLEYYVLNGARFRIPLYQRLYVWEKEQVTALLADLCGAFRKGQDYYLGGVTVMENSQGTYDLIDGQQRFTTLWLLGYELDGELKQFLYSDDVPRLSFAIREFSNKYLRAPSKRSGFTPSELSELALLMTAMDDIRQYLKEWVSDEERGGLPAFIYRQVKLVETRMPSGTDENELFEAMNNRGEQLQQHELLKSKLLHVLPEETRTRYARLWDTCSQMDDYLEKNIKEISELTWSQLIGGQEEGETQLPKDTLDRIGGESGEAAEMSLLSVLQEPVPLTDERDDDKKRGKKRKIDEQYSSGKVQSIITFPMLLLHTLRIYLFQREKDRPEKEIPPVDGTRLLDLFEQHFLKALRPENEAANFMDLLWEVRTRFDKHIIKWITIDNIRVHGIKKLYRSGDGLERRDPEGNNDFALLQSMLYHSQENVTQYWLTPLLYKLLRQDEPKKLSDYLRKLDNAMFSSNFKPTKDLRLLSWELTGDSLVDAAGDVDFFDLDRPYGTDFSSYTFYKLDYVLWFLRQDILKEENNESIKEKWESFRMTSRSSVEHISPQHPKPDDPNTVWQTGDDDETKREKQDDFGNLVLISGGMNSEYSNKGFSEKRGLFRDKPRLDSLKSALIFRHDHWNYRLCEEHRQQMEVYLRQYFELTK